MRRNISFISSGLILGLMIFFAIRVNRSIPNPKLTKQDIYYSFVEGQRISAGNNPYERILTGNMLENKKYATYFPLFYEISFVSQKLGLSNFEDWITFWGRIFELFNYGIAILIYLSLSRQKLEWGGVFASGFWLFNRWTLKMIETVNFDFIPIFFLLAALVLFPRKKWLSLFLLSISLGFKQIAIIIAPLFVIWTYQLAESNREKIRQSLLSIGILASIPLLSSIPFLFWNAQGLIKSVLFSATRLADNQFSAQSLDVIWGLGGPAARIPMLVLILAIYWMAYKKIGNKYILAMLIMAVFINFNSVLYDGYMTWFFALIPLLISDQYSRNSILPSGLDVT